LFGNSRQAWYERKKRLSEWQMQEVFILKQAKELRQEQANLGQDTWQTIKPVWQTIKPV